jgi:hypothetical protein
MDVFTEVGEIARLDVGLSGVTGSVLVTFYDARATARLLVELPDRAEGFPGLPHDFRAVKVNMAAANMGTNVGFGDFGAVANCSVVDGDVVVEFFDMRAAQRLLAAVRPGGMPWPPMTEGSTASLAQMPMQMPSCPFEPPGLQAPVAPGLQAPVAPGLQPGIPLVDPGLIDNLISTLGAAEQASQRKVVEAPPPGYDATSKNNQKGKTKVASKDFSKFDIIPDMIQGGKDSRTTVMVRNLSGASARQDFLKLLEVIGLAERYTFFYMPCKEHSNVLAGFAFVNFVSPDDVYVLHDMVKKGVWRAAYTDRIAKAPAVSYARYQGHDQLVVHFRSSAVLYENDPEKRPIFRPNAGQNYAEYTDCHPAFAPGLISQQSAGGIDPNVLPTMLEELKLGAVQSALMIQSALIIEA